MSSHPSHRDFKNFNPIDLIEDMAMGQDWAYQRTESEEIMIDLDAKWAEYRIQFFWQRDFNVLHLAMAIDMPFDPSLYGQVFELIACLNYRLVMGHFEFSLENHLIAYRLNQYLESPKMIKMSHIENLIHLSLSEVDRFYPAFQLVTSKEKTAQEAMSVALLDTMGEA